MWHALHEQREGLEMPANQWRMCFWSTEDFLSYNDHRQYPLSIMHRHKWKSWMHDSVKKTSSCNKGKHPFEIGKWIIISAASLPHISANFVPSIANFSLFDILRNYILMLAFIRKLKKRAECLVSFLCLLGTSIYMVCVNSVILIEALVILFVQKIPDKLKMLNPWIFYFGILYFWIFYFYINKTTLPTFVTISIIPCPPPPPLDTYITIIGEGGASLAQAHTPLPSSRRMRECEKLLVLGVCFSIRYFKHNDFRANIEKLLSKSFWLPRPMSGAHFLFAYTRSQKTPPSPTGYLTMPLITFKVLHFVY